MTEDFPKHLLACDYHENGEAAGADLLDREKDPEELKSRFDDPKYARILAIMEKKLDLEMRIIDIRPDQLPGGKGK